MDLFSHWEIAYHRFKMKKQNMRGMILSPQVLTVPEAILLWLTI